MPELIKRGHIYIAQPPLYQISRRGRVEYVEDDQKLSKILIELGTEECQLRNLADGRVLTKKQLAEVLDILVVLERYARAIQRHGGDFAEYVEHRHKKTNELPQHMVRIREGNEEKVVYFHTEEELEKFAEGNPDLQLFGDAEGEEEAERPQKNGIRRRSTYIELHESKAISELLLKLARKGFNIEHYSAQDKPLFELIEGEGPNVKVRPLYSIPEILQAVREVGSRGLEIKRFKGLGEMNPSELYETTMNPATRKLLRVELVDAIEAEEMFSKLMGEEVEPRRQFIEDNALNVRNLDI